MRHLLALISLQPGKSSPFSGNLNNPGNARQYLRPLHVVGSSTMWSRHLLSGNQPLEQEPAMKPKFNSTKGLAVLVVIAAFGLETAHSHAAPKRKNSNRGSVYYYGPGGPLSLIHIS